MDFDDTPEEAEFRAVARAWIAANRPDNLLSALAEAEETSDPRARAQGVVESSRAWQKRKARFLSLTFSLTPNCWPRRFSRAPELERITTAPVPTSRCRTAATTVAPSA